MEGVQSPTVGLRRRSEVHREIAPVSSPFHVNPSSPSKRPSPTAAKHTVQNGTAVPTLDLASSPQHSRQQNPYSPRVLSRRPQHQLTPRAGKTSHSVASPGFGSSAPRFRPSEEDLFDPETTTKFSPKSIFDPKGYVSQRPPAFGRSANRFQEEQIFKSTTPGPGVYEPDEWEDEMAMSGGMSPSPRRTPAGTPRRSSPPAPRERPPQLSSTSQQSPSPRASPARQDLPSSPSPRHPSASPAVAQVLESEGLVVHRPSSPGRRATVASGGSGGSDGGGSPRGRSPSRNSDGSGSPTGSPMRRMSSYNRHFLNSPAVEEMSKEQEEEERARQERERKEQAERDRVQKLMDTVSRGATLKKYVKDGKGASHMRFLQVEPASAVLKWKNSASSSDSFRSMIITKADKDLSGMARQLPEQKQKLTFAVYGAGVHDKIYVRCGSEATRDQWVEGINIAVERKNRGA